MERSTVSRLAALGGAMLVSGVVAAVAPMPDGWATGPRDDGLAGAGLTDEQRRARDEGRAMYWQVVRTYHAHLPTDIGRMFSYRIEDTQMVLRWMAIQPGATVGDIGCGGGYYTMTLAEDAGPDGVVLATDMDPSAVEFLRERLELLPCEGCATIRVSVNTVDDVGLDPGTLDVALMANLDFYAYPELTDENVSMLHSVARALRPGGRLVVVQDLDAAPGSDALSMERNIGRAGFTLVRKHEGETAVFSGALVPWVMMEWRRDARDCGPGPAGGDADVGRRAPRRPPGLGKPGH